MNFFHCFGCWDTEQGGVVTQGKPCLFQHGPHGSIGQQNTVFGRECQSFHGAVVPFRLIGKQMRYDCIGNKKSLRCQPKSAMVGFYQTMFISVGAR
jgi:hypothetical protein